MKKKVLATLLVGAMVAGMLAGCGGNSGGTTDGGAATEVKYDDLYPHIEGVELKAKDGTAAPDWTEYDALIEDIRMETDTAKREELMHKAEDILMETSAVIPLYYYNDLYMQVKDVDGIYSNLFGFKYFQFAESPRDVLKINLSSEPAKDQPFFRTG